MLWVSRDTTLIATEASNTHRQDLLRCAQSLVELAEGLPDIAFQLSVLQLLCQRYPMLMIGNGGLGIGGHFGVEMAETFSDVKLTCMVQGREKDRSGDCVRDLTGCCTEANTALGPVSKAVLTPHVMPLQGKNQRQFITEFAVFHPLPVHHGLR